MKISFGEEPAVGLVICIDGQRFDLIGADDHTKLDGALTRLLVWKSACPMCGDDFIARSPSHSMPATRRCERHRAPGKKVKSI